MAESAFRPSDGVLSAEVFSNPKNGIPPTLYYEIVIPVRVELHEPIGCPLFTSDEPMTCVQFEYAVQGLVHWRDLPSQTYHFPTDYDDEYPDNSIYLGGTHHYAYLTELRFVELHDNSLKTVLDIEFDLSMLRPLPTGLQSSFSVHWEINLEVDEEKLDNVMEEATKVLTARNPKE